MQLVSRFVVAAALIAPLFFATPVAAQGDEGPREIFRRCSLEIRELVSRCTREHRETVRECLPRIRRLLNEGEQEQAREVARRCINHIEEVTIACRRNLGEICETCIRRLEELEATELAEAMRRRCGAAENAINRSARKAIKTIRNLFDDRPDDPE